MSKRSSLIAFVAAVVMQTLILVAVPALKAITLATGKSAALKVQPVDPYNILSGYYVTLRFDISNVNAFPIATEFSNGDKCYAVIERGDGGIWKPVSLERELPANLPDNRVALKGRINYGQIEYGIEAFYIPETRRAEIGEDLRRNPDKTRAEIKVDSRGNAALERLRIEDRIYE